MTSPAHPLFLGNHPAIDFLNTYFAPNGVPTETIPDGRALLDWMISAGLIEDTAAKNLMRRLGGEAIDSAAAEARKVREWARRWLERWRFAPEHDYGEEIAILNRLLARGAWQREVVVTAGEGFKLAERVGIDSADALLALIASSIADLITQERASLVKQCAGAGCTLWFLDRTKAHKRSFCSAAVCGNRAKVAAFRERQRA